MAKTYLKVDYKEKDLVKSLGSMWDAVAKKWYVPEGFDLTPFAKWLPAANTESSPLKKAEIISSTIQNSDIPEKGIALSQLLQSVSKAISQSIPSLVWIKAEISEYREPPVNSHYHYLDLVEVNSNHQILCKTKAKISKNVFSSISTKFQKETGDSLKAGMKVLILVKVDFHVQHGFGLTIEDIDPNYTLGDMAAKLANIRARLQQEGIYDRNKNVIPPKEFTQIAVVSPDGAAGLGDFQKEANLLRAHNLCKFKYYTAQFQGQNACDSIKESLVKVIQDHKILAFDSIIIIRGGGSAIDLAWLNDYSLSKMICECPLAIFTGIGHERDNTILDEVANRKFDTPSKVIAYIFNIISNNAQSASDNFSFIKSEAGRILASIEINISNLFANVCQQSESNISICDQILEKFYFLILNEAGNTVREKGVTIDVLYQNIISKPFRLLEQTHKELSNLYSRICETSLLHINNLQYGVYESWKSTLSLISTKTKHIEDELYQFKQFISSSVEHIFHYSDQNIKTLFEDTKANARNCFLNAKSSIKDLIIGILALGPKNTLKRGFSIIHNQYGKTITSFNKAKEENVLKIQFHDGSINTKII